MKAKQNSNLSFFEAIYIWMYIYTTKSTFLTGRGTAERSACMWLALTQLCNVLFLSLLFEIQNPLWIMIVIYLCLIVINVISFEKNIDSIVERHNALTVKERMANKLKMWIYVIVTGLSMVGLFIASESKRETPKTESMRDRLKIEIQNQSNSNLVN